MNLSERIWLRASKDRAVPKVNEFIGCRTEVWGASSQEGHPPRVAPGMNCPQGKDT